MNKYIKIKITILSIIAALSIIIFFLGNRVAYAQTYNTDDTNTQNNARADSISAQTNDITQITLSRDEQEVLDLVNQQREKQNLAPLVIDVRLQEIAELKAQDMVNNNYFAHQSATYGSAFDMMKADNIWYRKAGENLAGDISNKTAVLLWMNSKSHRDNILDSGYQKTGIAVVSSPKYGKIFVQMFIQE